MSVIENLAKNSTIKESSLLSISKFFTKKDMITTKIPVLNVALSGQLDGGFVPGLTLFAGPSKHFKSLFSLILAKSYLEKYPDAAMIFYDAEFGTPLSYFQSLGIDQSRVLHVPLMNLEELKFDVVKQLEQIERGDRVIILVDSLGALASKKEVDDAIDGKSVADMSRAKSMKSLFRMVTPYLNRLDIPMIGVSHVYDSMNLFPTKIVSGGQGAYLAADTIFIVGRQQQKDGTDVTGYNFLLNIEKSRYVKEKSKIPIEVSFEGGISKWSGLLDIALDSGHVIKPSQGWFSRVNEEKRWRRKDTDCSEFWMPILTTKSFNEYINTTYQVANGSIMQDNELDTVVQSIEDMEDE